MPITPVNPVVPPPVPNAVLIPFVRLDTHVDPVTKALVTAANIGFQAAHVDEAGKYTPLGNVLNTTIPDLNNLPPDVVALAAQVAAAETALLTVLAEINAIRKLV